MSVSGLVHARAHAVLLCGALLALHRVVPAMGDVAILSSNSGVTSPQKRTYDPEPKLVEGLIQAGFPRCGVSALLSLLGLPPV